VLSRIRENREVIEDAGFTLPYVQMQDFGVNAVIVHLGTVSHIDGLRTYQATDYSPGRFF
jgi:hypothetical protein